MSDLSSIPAQKNPMFAFLLTSVLLGAGTYVLYKYLFNKSDEEEEEYPQPYNTGMEDGNAEENEEDEQSGPSIKIFYGSQSGTAEGFAFDMQKESKKYGFNGKVIDLEDYDTEELQNEKCVIFLVATYGEGEPTDNAQEFYNWLNSSDRIESDELPDIEFAVFGLGNSQYEFFCEMGKQFDELLEKLGGTRLIERGVSDDDLSPPEDQFNEWKKKLWPILSERYLGVTVDTSGTDKFENTIQIEYVIAEESKQQSETKTNETKDDTATEQPTTATTESKEPSTEPTEPTEPTRTVNKEMWEMANSVKHPFIIQYNKELRTKYSKYYDLLLPFRKPTWMDNCVSAPMVVKTEARPSAIDGSSMHVEFDISESEDPKFSYETADNLGICVRNDYKIVGKLCKRLKINPKDVIRIVAINKDEPLTLHIPKVTTIRNLFLWHLDINEMPRKALVSTLSQFAKNDGEKMELMKLAESGVKKEDYLTFYQILKKYPSIDVDLATVIEILRPLQPRMFTIASSNKVQPKKIAALCKMEFEFNKAFQYSSYNLSRVNLFSGLEDGFDPAEAQKNLVVPGPSSSGASLSPEVSPIPPDSPAASPSASPRGELIPLHKFYSSTKFEGACSHYLFNSKVTDKFQIYIQPSTFRLPATHLPVIMISSGAGLAPFKAFLQEGNDLIKSGKHKIEEFGEWWCIFGCRSVKIDYLYKKELESSLTENGGCLKELKIAFSRDEEGKKVYVQDIIDQNSEKLWKLISEKNGRIYVCGGLQMGKGVRAAFARIFDFYNKGQGTQYLDDMLKKNHFVQELWG